jgi:DNA-binding response OmpR family regulator
MKVLIVDDERDIQDLFRQKFRKELKNRTFDFVFAFSGEDANSYLLKHPDDVAIILSDINMPGMSGLELLQKIRAKHKKAPPKVFMISAYGDEDNYQTAMNLGADDFFIKPIDFLKLKTKMQTDM